VLNPETQVQKPPASVVQIPADIPVSSYPETRDPSQFAYELSFPPVMTFENPIIGISCND
jgi:hypothetical protein